MNFRWAPVTTVTGHAGNQVEVDSPVAAARVRLHRDALARLIVGASIPAAMITKLEDRKLITKDVRPLAEPFAQSSVSLPADADIAVWQERGWGLSLAFYLWSRRADFHDDGKDGAVRRVAALSDMLAREPTPVSEQHASGDTFPLAKEMSSWTAPPLGETLARRRSTLKPRGGQLCLADLAVLLRYGARRFRASRRAASAPGPVTNMLISFGSAIDLYAIVYKCNDLPEGIYQFNPINDTLCTVRVGPVHDEARRALLAHPDPDQASATLALVADFARYQWRYRHERALRNLWLDAGRIMQDLLITATALNLETGLTPALGDSLFLEMLGLEGRDQQALHTLSVSGRRLADGP
jgi:SagB-type dehydrogenase family enzyme